MWSTCVKYKIIISSLRVKKLSSLSQRFRWWTKTPKTQYIKGELFSLNHQFKLLVTNRIVKLDNCYVECDIPIPSGQQTVLGSLYDKVMLHYKKTSLNTEQLEAKVPGNDIALVEHAYHI